MPVDLFLSRGVQVEVVHARSRAGRPRNEDVRRLWKRRWGQRPTAVLLVVEYEHEGTTLARVAGLHDEVVAPTDRPISSVEALVFEALDSETDEAAERLLESLFADVRELAHLGLRNEGLFADHELLTNAPHRDDWSAAGRRAEGFAVHRGRDLLEALGWSLVHEGSDIVLGHDDRDRAVAVVLEGDEVFDRASSRFGHSSPVEHAIAVARRRGLTWVLAVQGATVRLYTPDPDVGIRRQGTATFTEVDVAVLDAEHRAYATLLLTPEALQEDGTALDLLRRSSEHATALGNRLRDRVYEDVVGDLAVAVARRHGSTTEQELHDAYHQSLVILFRLLFVAYAEERGLLPHGRNTVYTRLSLKTRAIDYARAGRNGTDHDQRATDVWDDLKQIWRAVREGHSEWGIPAYGGGLFDEGSAAGRGIASLTLTNHEIGRALEHLVVDEADDGTYGPVDFQALSVREFGTIYEGLLESSLSLAPTDLALDAAGTYVPATKGADVRARKGEVFFHNASGARKATGSYFTKQFAVEHLVGTALDPTVREHLDRVRALLDDGDEAGAAELLFDFRVADLAMGSGHFLVAAIDHVSAAFFEFLEQHPIPRVATELAALQSAAEGHLAEVGQVLPDLQRDQWIRRQVARRCIYGVDLNEVAVDLAKLALWIHTFVPGLPMSTLDHGLVVGNALTGIGTIEEALDIVEPEAAPGQYSFFREGFETAMAAGTSTLRRAGRLAESTVDETAEAQALLIEARDATEPTRRVLDSAVAHRIGEVAVGEKAALGWDEVVSLGRSEEVADVVERLRPVHFPVAFPEVFTRDRPGFDVVLGNPPWEKVKVEEHGWWGLRFPGLRSMTQADKNAAIAKHRRQRPDLVGEYEVEVAQVAALRKVLKAGPYPGGAGDTDLYKIFCWRTWDLLRNGGRLGIVFPRGAHSGSATAAWRGDVLASGGLDVTFLTNTGNWAFDGMEPRYTIGLTTASRSGVRQVAFAGPFHSGREFAEGRGEQILVGAQEFESWSSAAVFPLLPDARSADLFRLIRRAPRLDSRQGLAFRPATDLHATGNKDLLHFAGPTQTLTTPVLTGGSFNLWTPDAGEPYAHASHRVLRAFFHERLQRQVRNSRSPFHALPPDGPPPFDRPRIAFRDVARATDRRTSIVALIPPGSALTHKAPYLYRREGGERDEAFLLGVMSSIPFDWYARRYVEVTMSYELLNPMPVPHPYRTDPLWRRVVTISGRLAAVDDRYADWAAAVGVPVDSVTEGAEKDDLIYELDAIVSLLYGLEREHVEHVFETFHRGWDFRPRLDAVLAHYDRWKDQA